MQMDEVLVIAARAVQMYEERKPRPPYVNQVQASEMLGVSKATVSRMVKAGSINLNGVGLIPIGQIDLIVAARLAA